MDYKALGLKCGLEVHQQLETGKLFCRCPSLLMEGEPDYTFERKLRAVASELGEFDPAVLEQVKKGLTYEYRAWHDCCCLVECDEEPPKPADPVALETALKVALMAGAKIFGELFVMRKTVIDGSNTSGFQRTMLVAENGKLDINGKEIGIQTIVLEEDASRPVEKKGKKVIYNLDRQGIPLIEIATAPELCSPEEAQLCAEKIGELLRLTCRAKRGLGSIRQDINISIAKGARIELKGVQELGMIAKYVEREVQRQAALVEIKEELGRRGVEEKYLVGEREQEASEVFRKTACMFVLDALKKGEKAFALRLRGFSGFLGKELQPGRRFGTELADYLKARHGINGLLHSDELPKYGVSEEEKKAVWEKLGCKAGDAFAVVFAGPETAESAFNTVRERCALALEGVPGETRNALEGGNSCYMRPLPGAARMYPETDIRTVAVEKKWLEMLGKGLPSTVEERLALYKEHGLSGKLAEDMKLSNRACFYGKLLAKGFNATTAAALLLDGFNKLEREGVRIHAISEESLEGLLEAEKSGGLSKDQLLDAAKMLAEGFSLEQAVEELSRGRLGSAEVEKVIQGIIERNSGIIAEKGERAAGALMGDAMKELKGKASGKEAMELLEQGIRKELK